MKEFLAGLSGMYMVFRASSQGQAASKRAISRDQLNRARRKSMTIHENQRIYIYMYKIIFIYIYVKIYLKIYLKISITININL